MIPDERNSSDDKAPFNMALDTLRAIRNILNDISTVASDGLLSPAQKQFIIVQKVKYTFIAASPLLKEEIVDKYKDKVLELKSKSNEVVITRNGITKKREVRLLYDPELDNKIIVLLLDIQRELQKEKYFMPPRKDLSRAITEM
jgi:hypothetical protein